MLPPRDLITVLLLTITTQCSGQPILPSLSYPVFIVSPPNVHRTQEGYPHDAQIQTHPSHPSLPMPPEQGYQVSQFHSQDELGRVVFGFHGPDQSRMESRAIDGSIRGSYSYIDPNGNLVRMQYWDDGNGFHVSGNALPNGQPAYTPEVAAARAEHLRMYNAVLQATQQLGPASDGTYDDGSYNSNPEINNHFGLPHFGQGNDGNSLFGDDSDSVSLDNPELFGDFPFPEEEAKDKEKPGISQVEGEVELGEDVGPDEDEEDVPNDEEIKNKYEGPNDFDKHKNVKKGSDDKIKQHIGSNFKFSHDFGKVEDKNVLKQGNENNGEHETDDELHHDDNKHNEDEDNFEDPHSDDHDHDENDNNENHDDEPNNYEKHDDEHNNNETYDEEHDNDKNHEGNNNGSDVHDETNVEEHEKEELEGDNHDEEEDIHFPGYFGDRLDLDVLDHEEDGSEHSDAETAENRKSHVSQAMPSSSNLPQPAIKAINKVKVASIVSNPDNTKEKIQDQITDKSNMNPYVSSFNPSRPFFYGYQYTIPKPVERIDIEAERNPIGYLERTHSLNGPPQIDSAPNIPSPAIAQPSALGKQSVLVRPASFFASPLEVHDPQVSPYQAAYRMERIR